MLDEEYIGDYTPKKEGLIKWIIGVISSIFIVFLKNIETLFVILIVIFVVSILVNLLIKRYDR